jgi:hypothetical protein
MRHSSFLASVSLSALLACAACTDLQSADLKTAGMSANMTVQVDDSGQTTASATLNVDDNSTDFVTLSSGDSLTTSVAGQTQTMTENDALNDVSYSTTFSNEEASGLVYTIAFNRSSGNTSAPSSTCTLPAPFTIASPTTSGSFSRATADIEVNYGSGGSSDGVQYTVQGACVQGPLAQELDGDPGTFTIPHGAITPNSPSQSSQTCSVTLTITRTRMGQLDPAYGSGGQIECLQARSVTFESTP